MFWGLIMEPQKRYSQVIKKAFHISMASLDLSNSDGQPSQVMCGYEGRNYLLCTLQKPGLLQSPLDLYFEEGSTVSFATNGKSHVHLTGYLTKDVDEMGLEEESDEEAQEFEVKAQKKPGREDAEGQPLKKKAKKAEAVQEEEDDESDDSDVDLEKLMKEGEEQSEDESGEEEDSGEEDADFSDEEAEDVSLDEEEDDDADEVEEEEETKAELIVNGLGKKSKKAKKESPKKESQQTPKKDTQGKEKPSLKQTPGPKGKKQENGQVGDQKNKEKKQPQASKKRTLPGGVVVEDLKEGNGDAAGNGKFVHVYYEGRLKSNNKVFDKTQNGPGFGFRLGKGEVIKGWDIGVGGMKVGGKRRITCPPHLAYGAKGSPPVIPPNSTLVFEVELKKIK